MLNKIKDWQIPFGNCADHFSTNQSCLPETGPGEQDHLSDISLLPVIFHWNYLKSCVPFTLQTEFPETFCKMLNHCYLA